MPAKAIIYTRFSPRPNADESESCEKQDAICREYCEKQKYEVAHYFEDRDASGDEADRPGLWKAINSLRRGMVLVVRWRSRLARDVYLTEVIERAVERVGARIEAVEESNGTKPEDRLGRQILAAFREYEKSMIGIRTKYAMRKHQKAGRRMSHHVPYGWMQDPENDKLIIPDEHEQAGIDYMMDMREQGMSLRKLAEHMNQEKTYLPKRADHWDYRVIDRILKREYG